MKRIGRWAVGLCLLLAGLLVVPAFAAGTQNNNPGSAGPAVPSAPPPIAPGGSGSNNVPGFLAPELASTADAPIPLSPVAFPIGYIAYPDSCQFDTLGAFTAVGEVVFDTDALTFGGAPGGIADGSDAIFAFDSMLVPAGTSIRGVGSRRLILISDGPASIAGTVQVNGANATPTAPSCQPRTTSPGGAGGGAGGLGTVANPGAGLPGSGTGGGGSPPPGAAGAGGAGFGGTGGPGGGGGAGGAAYGDLLTALEGGSGGGGASTNSGDGCQGASGGGGGGGLLLSSATSITIAATGVVSANGGNGALSDMGASGAGSGGAIVLRAPAISHAGAVRANGGGGGGGGCCGGGGGAGGGRILVVGAAAGAGTYSVAGGPASSGNPGGGAGASGVALSAPYASPCLGGFCQLGALGDFTAAGTVVFDTDAGTYGGLPGGILFDGKVYFYFDHVTVPLATTVRGVGSRPLVIAAADTMLISGTVHVDGSNATPTAPSCQPRTTSPGGAGGGAGGLGTAANPGAGLPGSGPGGGG